MNPLLNGMNDRQAEAVQTTGMLAAKTTKTRL